MKIKRKDTYLYLISRPKKKGHYKIYAQYATSNVYTSEDKARFKEKFSSIIESMLDSDKELIANYLIINNNQKNRYNIDIISKYEVYPHDWYLAS